MFGHWDKLQNWAVVNTNVKTTTLPRYLIKKDVKDKDVFKEINYERNNTKSQNLNLLQLYSINHYDTWLFYIQ